jgi:hypothetical protein
MPRVFISHSSADAAFVEAEILPPLRRRRIRYWYSPEDIQTSQDWEKSIRKGLESCEWFLVVMSGRSARSPWVRREVQWAMENRRDHVVPIRAEPCDLKDWPLGLDGIQHVDFSKDKEQARAKLLAVWCPGGSRPVTRRSRPEPGADRPGAPVVAVGTSPIELYINCDFNSFGSQVKEQLLATIGQLLSIGGDVRVVNRRPGSVRLTLELPSDRAERLFWAVERGELAGYGVEGARLIDSGLDAGDGEGLLDDLNREVAELHRQGRLEEALELAGLVLDWARRDLGEHPTTAVSLNNLGMLHRTLAHPAEAGSYYAEALALGQRLEQRESRDTRMSLNDTRADASRPPSSPDAVPELADEVEHRADG